MAAPGRDGSSHGHQSLRRPVPGGDLADQVELALGRHGLPPEALELEITENIVLSEDQAALEALSHLRRMGIGIAFDDFGTGYAS